jgi:hypothetical protein
MGLYYDREGLPITRERWSDLHSRPEYWRVGLDSVGRTQVSTVWLGIDHGHGGDGPPIIFETMVFVDHEGGDMERYSTEAAALEGHARMVERVRAAAM